MLLIDKFKTATAALVEAEEKLQDLRCRTEGWRANLWPPREANEQASRPGGDSPESGSANAWLAGAETHLALAKSNAARTVDRVQAVRQDLQAMRAPIDTLDQLRATLRETVVSQLNGKMLPLLSFNLPVITYDG